MTSVLPLVLVTPSFLIYKYPCTVLQCTQRRLYKVFFRFFTSYQDNTTPLYVASKEGHHDVVKTLLGAGADVNTTSVVSDAMFYSFTCNLISVVISV